LILGEPDANDFVFISVNLFSGSFTSFKITHFRPLASAFATPQRSDFARDADHRPEPRSTSQKPGLPSPPPRGCNVFENV
jgi:hypothetical protein